MEKSLLLNHGEQTTRKRNVWLALYIAIWSVAIQPVMPAYASLFSDSQSQQANVNSADRAAGVASSAASGEVERWLSGFGTARAKLDVDRHFSLKNSELDLLLPWYDNGNTVLFTQHGIRQTDKRNQTNQGAGFRYFGAESMSGVNLFFDHDLSRYHTRVSIGTELWRDYLKLGSNFYFGQGRWRSAPEFNHTREARAADGWDLRAEGWLPSYPQLGGNLKLEQYYGQEVALFGKDNRQKHPMALTAGAGWTPFPLLTVNAAHSIGSQGNNESRVGLQLNWALGATLSQHLNPDVVGAKRTLAGSRHDLVERNNNITLKYRGKDATQGSVQTFAALHADRASIINDGMEGAIATLTLVDENGLPVVGHIATLSVDLPGVTIESYTLGGVSTGSRTMTKVGPGEHKVIIRGTIAGTATLTATVVEPGVQINPVTLLITPVIIPAPVYSLDLVVVNNNARPDGVATNRVLATVLDENNIPVVGETVSFAADNGAVLASTTGVTDTNGQVYMTLTNTTGGLTNVTASINGSSKTVPVNFFSGYAITANDIVFASIWDAISINLEDLIPLAGAAAWQIDNPSVAGTVHIWSTNFMPGPGVYQVTFYVNEQPEIRLTANITVIW